MERAMTRKQVKKYMNATLERAHVFRKINEDCVFEVTKKEMKLGKKRIWLGKCDEYIVVLIDKPGGEPISIIIPR